MKNFIINMLNIKNITDSYLLTIRYIFFALATCHVDGTFYFFIKKNFRRQIFFFGG
jgi:hypothetical protein